MSLANGLIFAISQAALGKDRRQGKPQSSWTLRLSMVGLCHLAGVVTPLGGWTTAKVAARRFCCTAYQS
jgi:hypothetical protein